MQKTIIVISALAVACSPRHHARPDTKAVIEAEDSPASGLALAGTRMPDSGLNGIWMRGSTNEPAVRRIEMRLECNYTPALWVLEQHADTVRAYVIPESRAQGTLSPPPQRSVAAQGRISGNTIRMNSDAERYVLQYDSTSGHLRGTLNGQPFWAIREDLVTAENCIPVP